MTTAHDSPDSAELAPPQDDLGTRKILGPYELKRKLGQGGMGAVYLAVDQNLKRQVALKILPREKAINPQLVKRFKAEAQNASQLTHDNIVAVYGAGEADGYLFIALEFVDGIDVHDLVERRGVLPVKRSIDIIKQVARALQHALDQGIVHRDIKPANLLIRRDGMVKLADMGLARAVDESMETSITRAGTTVGTVDYMSPEQARNSKSADVRSDMYSLGCTWYHMLTGGPPFAEGSLTNKLTAHAKQPPPDARDKNPAVPEGVVAVMQRMLAKDPDERYQTPAELIRDLEGALVNKDAVSRKILEAIDDDSVYEDESADYHGMTSTGNSESYSVEMPWGDSVAEMQSNTTDSGPATPTHRRPAGTEAPLSDPETMESAPRSGVKKSSPTAGANRGTSNSPPPNTRQAPVPESEYDTAPPSVKANAPAAKHATTPSRHPTGGGSSKATDAPAKQQRHTLPPPKRKTPLDPNEKTASGMSKPVKLVVTALAIFCGVGLLVFLANLAQKAGEATAPVPILNPEGQVPLPPPPQAIIGPQQEVEVGSATDPQRKKADEVLIERKAEPDANGAGGAGSKSSGAAGAIAKNGAGTAAKLIPDWVDAVLPTGHVPMFSVRKGATVVGERRFATLQEALQSVGPSGARIVLFHDGPFDLTPFEFSGGMLVIEAAEGAHPQIKLVANGEHRKLPWLDVTNGTLILDGANFVGDVGTVPVIDPWSWIRVTSSHLYVRQSSFTLTGKRTGPTTAIKIAGSTTDPMTKEPTPLRFLLHQTVIRGDGLQSVQLESPGFDTVVRRSLLVTGDSTAISVLQSAEKVAAKASRKLLLVNSTVSSSGRGLQLMAKGTTNPVETKLVLHESLFAAPATTANPVFLSLEDWPANKSRGSDLPPFKNLNWTSTGSAILGFNPLLKVNSDETATVTDGPGWKKLWREQSPTTFAPLSWPAEVPGGIAQAPLKTWSLKSLETLAVAFPTPNVTPGCPVSELGSADQSADAKSLASQPQRPRVPVPFVAKSVQQIDLNKNADLGKVINSKAWEDGTVFVASGSGQRYSSPILVEGHKWRIQFVQTEGSTLLIAPRGGPRSGGENSAFITVRNGQLEIEQGTFTYDLKDSSAVAPWFLYGEGGGLALTNCRIVVPASTASRSRGIIRWAKSATEEKAIPDSEFANFCQITNSLLVGNGTIISADLPRRALVLNNSAFISRQHLFEINVGQNEGQLPAAVDAQNCTFLSVGTQWAINSQAPATGSPLPVRFGNYNCVFAAIASDANSKAAPLLMNYVGQVPVDKQVLWYEESCGYAPDLKAFFAAMPTLPTTPLADQDYEAEWNKRWGPDRIQRPLHSTDGVLFEKTLVGNFTQVRPENLTFHKAAKARTWSESGGPIGAHPETFEPPPAPKRTAPGKKPGNKAQPKVTL